ncbi:MAG: AIPR family protein [Chloroflexota bacterium]|nr:AIPR family protein [Chloroflexota bacterium]
MGVEAGQLLRNIARFTNSQNAIRDQDFLALEEDFNAWAERMSIDYNVFMETQRGQWESQQAFQQQNPQARRFKDHANAFDLIKVYGAGWIGLPGVAFSDNAPFIPPVGSVYRQIIDENQD